MQYIGLYSVIHKGLPKPVCSNTIVNCLYIVYMCTCVACSTIALCAACVLCVMALYSTVTQWRIQKGGSKLTNAQCE